MSLFLQKIQISAFPVIALAASVFLVGCGRKTETGYISPPAAIGTPVTDAMQPPPAGESVAAVPAEPEPFQLRPDEQLIDYTVKKGDSLWAIGRKYGVSSSRIRSANGMTSDMIRYGSKIKVPTSKAGSVSAPAPVTVPRPAPTPAPAPVAVPRPAAPVTPTPVPTPAPVAPKPVPQAAQPKVSPPPAFQLSEPKPIPAPQVPAGGLQFSD